MSVQESNLPLEEDQVSHGVHALYEYVKRSQASSVGLLDDIQQINLQLGFKKAPTTKTSVIKIVLPHTLICDVTDVCLFVKDLDKTQRDYEPTVTHFEQLLQEKGVKCITKVIPLKALKTEYLPFEAKRNLSDMYDTFLADDRIIRLLPDLLGKHFYGRKRYPKAVNLGVKELKNEMDKVLATALCSITGRGSSCQVTIAHNGLTEKQATENIIAAAEKLASSIPGGAANIRSLHIKTVDSPSLPVYIDTGSGDDVRLPPQKRKLELDEPEEVDTVENARVRVTPHGDIQIFQDGEEWEQMPKRAKSEKDTRQKRTVMGKGGRKTAAATNRASAVTGSKAALETHSKEPVKPNKKDKKSDTQRQTRHTGTKVTSKKSLEKTTIKQPVKRNPQAKKIKKKAV